MSYDHTWYLTTPTTETLRSRFASALGCQFREHPEPDSWFYSGPTCDVDVLSNLGETFEDIGTFIGAHPIAVCLTPFKGETWEEETYLLRQFIDTAADLVADEPDTGGVLIAFDDAPNLAARLPGEEFVLDRLLLETQEFNQYGYFSDLPRHWAIGDLQHHLTNVW